MAKIEYYILKTIMVILRWLGGSSGLTNSDFIFLMVLFSFINQLGYWLLLIWMLYLIIVRPILKGLSEELRKII